MEFTESINLGSKFFHDLLISNVDTDAQLARLNTTSFKFAFVCVFPKFSLCRGSLRIVVRSNLRYPRLIFSDPWVGSEQDSGLHHSPWTVRITECSGLARVRITGVLLYTYIDRPLD
ncbi:hypothetical protein AVEN_226542-1 [Araneus ventricosus]|uniref:Uncharacterized protein n=1 Tax=Araneus ventricosus TaxID=182803 RepID=A0A4Y2TCY5_ARAVE|nr:hypothetical protein AVEN_226542-1 [Araneus ventricosus]